MIPEAITHLSALLLPENGAFVSVDNAWTSEPFEQVSGNVPALLVVPGDYETMGPTSDNLFNQMETKSLGLWLIVNVPEFEQRRNELIKQIQGYIFNQEASGFILTTGKVRGLQGNLIWFEQVVTTEAPEIL